MAAFPGIAHAVPVPVGRCLAAVHVRVAVDLGRIVDDPPVPPLDIRDHPPIQPIRQAPTVRQAVPGTRQNPAEHLPGRQDRQRHALEGQRPIGHPVAGERREDAVIGGRGRAAIGRVDIVPGMDADLVVLLEIEDLHPDRAPAI